MNMIDLIQRTWPDWYIDRMLCHGADGCVYRAKRRNSAEPARCAIKAFDVPAYALEPDCPHALDREGQTVAGFLEKQARMLEGTIRLLEAAKDCANLVAIEEHRVIPQPELPGWVVLIRMDLLTPLKEYIPIQRKPDHKKVVKLGIDICNALTACRERNIACGEVTPERIFVSCEGDFKLGGFCGIGMFAPASKSAVRLGANYYMAPEVYGGSVDEADPDAEVRIELYALGIILYTLLNNGCFPFAPTERPCDMKAVSRAMSLRLRGEVLPEPLHGGKALKRVVLKACSFDPGMRFGSAAEMREALLKLPGWRL